MDDHFVSMQRRQSNLSRVSSATEKVSGSRKISVESIAGTGINVVRQRGSKLNAVQPTNRKLNKSVTAPSNIAIEKRDDEPESIIGVGVDIRGTLEFERLLRIDGCFEGLLVSHGDLMIGPTGSLIGHLKGIQNLVIDGGKIVGNVSVQRIVMIGKASIEGNVTCKSLKAGTESMLLGLVNIHPRAPELIDVYGNIITNPIKIEESDESEYETDDEESDAETKPLKPAAPTLSVSTPLKVEEANNKGVAKKAKEPNTDKGSDSKNNDKENISIPGANTTKANISGVTTPDAKGLIEEEVKVVKYRVGDVVQFPDPTTGKPTEAMVIDIHNTGGLITVFSKEAVVRVDPSQCKRMSKASDYEVGDKVEARPIGLALFFVGYIIKLNEDATVDVRMEGEDPDDIERNIPIGDSIRKLVPRRLLVVERWRKAFNSINAIQRMKKLTAKGIGKASPTTKKSSNNSDNSGNNTNSNSTSNSQGGSATVATIGKIETPTATASLNERKRAEIPPNSNGFQLVSGTVNEDFHHADKVNGGVNGSIKYRVGDVVKFADPTITTAGTTAAGLVVEEPNQHQSQSQSQQSGDNNMIEAVVIDVHSDQGVLTVFHQEKATVVDMAKCSRVSKSTDFEVGDKVEARPKGLALFFVGYIIKLNEDATVDVRMEGEDPDDIERNIPIGDSIRKLVPRRLIVVDRWKKAFHSVQAVQRMKNFRSKVAKNKKNKESTQTERSGLVAVGVAEFEDEGEGEVQVEDGSEVEDKTEYSSPSVERMTKSDEVIERDESVTAAASGGAEEDVNDDGGDKDDENNKVNRTAKNKEVTAGSGATSSGEGNESGKGSSEEGEEYKEQWDTEQENNNGEQQEQVDGDGDNLGEQRDHDGEMTNEKDDELKNRSVDKNDTKNDNDDNNGDNGDGTGNSSDDINNPDGDDGDDDGDVDDVDGNVDDGVSIGVARAGGFNPSSPGKRTTAEVE